MAEQTPDNRVAQVQVIPFRKSTESEEWEVLILKRNQQKGGFWQPVTGGIEPAETPSEAGIREAEEEIGVNEQSVVDVINDDYRFEFTDTHRGEVKTFTEYVLALVLKPDFEPTLSVEHTESRWTSLAGALDYLKYDSNKRSVEHYWSLVAGEPENEQD